MKKVPRKRGLDRRQDERKDGGETRLRGTTGSEQRGRGGLEDNCQHSAQLRLKEPPTKCHHLICSIQQTEFSNACRGSENNPTCFHCVGAVTNLEQPQPDGG